MDDGIVFQQRWSPPCLLALGLALHPALPLPASSQAQAPDPKNTLVIELKTGRVLIKLRPDLAPKHVERVRKASPRRVSTTASSSIASSPGFMAQTGDPTGTGGGGSKLANLPAEFTKERFKRGSVGAARTTDPNSANSQFFICYGGSAAI